MDGCLAPQEVPQVVPQIMFSISGYGDSSRQTPPSYLRLCQPCADLATWSCSGWELMVTHFLTTSPPNTHIHILTERATIYPQDGEIANKYDYTTCIVRLIRSVFYLPCLPFFRSLTFSGHLGKAKARCGEHFNNIF